MSVVLGYLFLVLVLVARAWQYCAVLDRMVWPPSARIIRCNTSLSMQYVLKCIEEYFVNLGRVGKHLVKRLFLRLAYLHGA